MASRRTFHSAEPAAAGAADSFRPSDLWPVARSHAGLVATVALAVILIAVLALLLWPSSYSASAIVMLDTRKNNVADVTAVVSELPTDPASVQNQIQLLTSRDLAGLVIERLGLDQDPEFNRALATGLSAYFLPDDQSPQGLRNAEIDVFLKHLTVEAVGLSTAISVSFTSRDPQKSARIANAIADAYIETEMDVDLATSRTATQWLSERIRQLSKQVQAAESNVQAYKAEHDLNQTADGTSIVDQQLTAINAQLVDARSDLAEKQANSNRIATLMKTGHAADVSQIVASPLIVQLREQEATVLGDESQLSSKYGPKNPKLIAVETQKRDLADKIDLEVDRIAGSVANDVAVARAHVGSLQASLQQAEAQATDQNMAGVKLKALEANAASTRSMYEAFVVRLRETQSPIGIADARVISHASAPTMPSSPPRLLILGASVPAGVLLGLLMALLATRFGAGVPARRFVNGAIERLRGIPVLAEIPGAAAVRASDQIVDWPAAPFAQGVAALARRIAGGPKVVAITSSIPGEGHSEIAAALARTASLMGQRVVIVDGNLRGPAVARALGIAPSSSGLMDVLGAKATLSQALQKDTRSNAFVLSPAWRPRDAAQVLASPQMAGLIGHLRQTCDLILIDAPPLLAAPEARFLTNLADAVVLVVRADRTPPGAVAKAADALAATPVGLVLAR
jgi:succinoglycan biosynthesis transport protein ExoP